MNKCELTLMGKCVRPVIPGQGREDPGWVEGGWACERVWAPSDGPMYTGYLLIISMFTPSLPSGRGGWVWTRNFELDSVAYFFNFLWNYHQTQGLWNPGALLAETTVGLWGVCRCISGRPTEGVPLRSAPGRSTERKASSHCFSTIPSSGSLPPQPHVFSPPPILGA